MTEKKVQVEKTSKQETVHIFVVKDKIFSQKEILGLNLWQILAKEFEGFDITFLDDSENLLSTIKTSIGSVDKVVVLFCVSPAIEREDVIQALTNKNAVSFGKSFVASAQFIKNLNSLDMLAEFEKEYKENYLVIKNDSDIAKAGEILLKRIVAKHTKNGCEIEECIIDFLADIDEGARLAYSQILGECNIGQSIILSSVVKSSIVASGVTIERCVLKDCVVTKSIKDKNVDGGVV